MYVRFSPPDLWSCGPDVIRLPRIVWLAILPELLGNKVGLLVSGVLRGVLRGLRADFARITRAPQTKGVEPHVEHADWSIY